MYHRPMTARNPAHRASVLVTVAIAAMLVTASRSNQPAAQGAATAFIGVSVLPMDKDTLLADQTVIVADGKITSIAQSRAAQVPDGAAKIDGTGKYLMPGLGELHAHIPGGN